MKIKQSKAECYDTIEQSEAAGIWVEGICDYPNGNIKECPHLFICLCEEERWHKKQCKKNGGSQ